MSLKSESLIFNVTAETYPNPYTKKLEDRFVEKVRIDKKLNVYQEFETTFRNHKKLFFDGFVKYKFD